MAVWRRANLREIRFGSKDGCTFFPARCAPKRGVVLYHHRSPAQFARLTFFSRIFREYTFKFEASGTPCFAAERPRKEIWADHPCCTAVFALRNHSSGGAASWGGNLVSTGKPPHGSRNQINRGCSLAFLLSCFLTFFWVTSILPPETFLFSASCLLTFFLAYLFSVSCCRAVLQKLMS